MNDGRTQAAAVRQGARLLGAVGLLLVLSPLARAASRPAPAVSARSPYRVSWAMRGPLRTGPSQRLVVRVRGPRGRRPEVRILPWMPAMPMHERAVRARSLGDGRYSARVPLTMPGRWLASVTVGSGRNAVTASLPFKTIVAHPTPWRLIGAGAAVVVAAALALALRLRRRPPPSQASGPMP